MKIINWIVKALKFVKNSAELIKWIVIVILAISTFTGLKSCKKEKREKSNIVNILTAKIEVFKTESGLNASEVKNWIVKYETLDRLTSEISHDNSVYLNELAEAKETIKDLKLDEKRVKKYIKNELVSKDSITTDIIFLTNDKIDIKPIEQKHIKINFVQRGDELDITYLYKAEISTLINMERDKLTKKGNKRFILFQWIAPRWQENTTTVIDDKNATIDNIVSIDFVK
jgi:hypothetical protein